MDLTIPEHTPGLVLLVFKAFRKRTISKRMLTHEVSTTIRQCSRPADGRGSKSLFSTQDICLMLAGDALSELGLSPTRVLVCTDELRKSWFELFPQHTINEYELDSRYNPVDSDLKVLYAEFRDNAFTATIRGESEESLNPRPFIRYNATVGMDVNLSVTSALTQHYLEFGKQVASYLSAENLDLLNDTEFDWVPSLKQ